MKDGVRYQIYETRDGHVLFMASEQEFWKNFCEGVGRTDLFERGRARSTPTTPAATVELQRRAARRSSARRPRAEWLDFGSEDNTPIAPVNTPQTIAEDPQFRDRMPWIPPDAARRRPAAAARSSSSARSCRCRTKAPTVGEHTDEVLRDVLGYDDARLAALRAVGSPRMSASPADHDDAARFAEEAGRLLLGIRARIDAGEPVDHIRHEGDLRAHELLLARLTETHPDDAVLSEEGVDDVAPASMRRGSGSSIPSTARGSSASHRGPTGQCMSRS